MNRSSGGRSGAARGLAALAVIVSAWLPAALGAQGPAAPEGRSLAALSGEFERLAERVNPAVVQIFASGFVPSPGAGASGQTLLSRRSQSGSGAILDPAGYVVTNAHVVDGAQRIQVLLAEPGGADSAGRSILRPRPQLLGAQLVGLDRETDLAVIRIPGEGYPTLRFADSDDIRQGQLVFAFGSPLGLENSVSMGVVSSTARQLEPEAPMIYIQTDAGINPGNSGGPLVDVEGRLVGINTFIFSRSGGDEGLGFAAPSNIVQNVFEQIRATGRMRRGEIGATVQTITAELAAGLGLGRERGVIVADVAAAGPAERAGLRAGDVILTLNGKAMENGRQFSVNLYRFRVGDAVDLGVVRNGAPREFRVGVVERRDDPGRFLELVHPERNLIPRLGILVIELSPRVRGLLPRLRSSGGVVVASEASESPYWRESFRPGDLIVTLNRAPVGGIDDLRRRLDAVAPGAAIVVQIERDGELRYLAFEAP